MTEKMNPTAAKQREIGGWIKDLELHSTEIRRQSRAAPYRRYIKDTRKRKQGNSGVTPNQ